MAQLIWTEEALAWLRSIGDYIAQDSPAAAFKVTEGMYNKAQLLREFPRAGSRIVEIESREVRLLLYGHYRIVYEISDENCYVLGVFHASLNIDDIEY